MSMDEQGILYYEYTCLIPQNVRNIGDISFSKHKRYGTIYEVGGKNCLHPANYWRDFYLDGDVIGWDFDGDLARDDLIVTMFDFDGDNNEYFLKQVIAMLARKLHKASRKEKNK